MYVKILGGGSGVAVLLGMGWFSDMWINGENMLFYCIKVAAEDVDMAIGSDLCGSIRVPSSWSGIVGLKPTSGLVPFTGSFSQHPSFENLGPMTKTVADCALLLEVRLLYLI